MLYGYIKTATGKNSLTTPPTNFKEAIDWLALIGGYGRSGLDITNYSKLSGALLRLPQFTDIFNKNFSGLQLDSFVKRVTENLGSGFLGYAAQNSETFNGKGIVYGDQAIYKSTYYEASWEQSSVNDYAKIFLFLAVLIYYLITFLYWMCKPSGKWANKMTGHGALGDFFQTMGYDTWKELGNYKSGSQIAEHLESSHHGFDELSAAYQGASEKSYDAFLRTLEQRGPQQKISCPLTNCMRFCYEYLKSKQKERAITNAINDVKDALVALSTSRDISTTNDFSDLKQKIGTLLGKIHGFNPNHGSSRPGSSGTVSAIPVPKNLKEAIDWVLWMPADDLQGGEEGKEAIKILATKILTMLLRISLNGVQAATLLQGDIGEYGSNFQNYQPIVSLRKGVKDFIGYSNGVLNGNGIGARGVYLPAYSANSPFVQSLKANEEKIAKVFIGFIPLLFFGLTFLYWQCSNDGEWSKGTLSNGPLRQFLAEMGFTQGLNEFKSCAQITDMFSTFNEFKSAGSSNIDYFAFLKKVESATKSMLNTQPTSVPLGALYYFVFEYLKTKISNSSLRTVNVTPKSVEDVNKTLKGLSSAVKSLIPQDSEKLSNAYQKLLDQIRSALEQPQQETPAAEAVGAAANTAAASHAGSAGEHPASSQVQSSSGGAAAGSIFGVGAVGAGAAYSLDLFGLKGIIKNLLSFG